MLFAALPEKSTSHKAATRSLPLTDAFFISLIPFPPAPIAAMFKRSLGDINPGPPNTCLGTIKIELAKADFFTKLRRLILAGFFFLLSFMIVLG